MVREALAGFRESLVDRAKDLDLTEPAKAYVHLQKLVGMHGKPTVDGLTMHMDKPVGDIVAVTLDKNGGLYDLIAIHKDGRKRRLDAESFLEPDKVAELQALCNELANASV
mgnify:CR=1 FL=1